MIYRIFREASRRGKAFADLSPRQIEKLFTRMLRPIAFLVLNRGKWNNKIRCHLYSLPNLYTQSNFVECWGNDGLLCPDKRDNSTVPQWEKPLSHGSKHNWLRDIVRHEILCRGIRDKWKGRTWCQIDLYLYLGSKHRRFLRWDFRFCYRSRIFYLP